MFPYIASTLLYRLHRRETQPALLSTAALSRKVESKLLDRAGSGSGHNYTVPGRWSAGALELRSSVSFTSHLSIGRAQAVAYRSDLVLLAPITPALSVMVCQSS